MFFHNTNKLLRVYSLLYDELVAKYLTSYFIEAISAQCIKKKEKNI
jgi:hypothetical protein